LSLNISSLSGPFQFQQNSHLASPSSLASSAAPYTDSFSYPNPQNGQDYFAFDEASLPSSVDPLSGEQIPPPVRQPSQAQQYGYRLPASQPSSPVRSIYPPGQAPYGFQFGRQRGATFSGTFSPYADFNAALASPLYALSQAPVPASAVPPHLAFGLTQSPTHSPLSASPQIGSSADIGYFTEIGSVAGLGSSDIPMEDATTPTPLVPGPAREGVQKDSNLMTMNLDMSAEMIDKLTLLDK
jgi:hypothetical protein